MINKVPTLVLAGSRDGHFRISRNAESYYHMVHNIDKKQANDYECYVLDGLNHADFMSRDFVSQMIKDQDIVSGVSQTSARTMVA